MAEIRVSVDDAFINELQEKLGLTKSSDLTREALTLFKWAAEEAAQGREILSAKPDGEDVHRLVMPSLSKVKKAV